MIICNLKSIHSLLWNQYYINMSTDSLTQMSEKYIREKAHVVDDNKVELEIKNVRVYPSTKEPTLHLECGFPFQEFFIRIELENFPTPGYDKILSLYDKPFINLDNLIGETIKIEIDSYNVDNLYNDNIVHPEIEELEITITFNGINAHLCKVLRYYEHSIESSKNISKLKSKVENYIKTYEIVEKSIKEKSELQVQEVIPDKNRSFTLKIGHNKSSAIPVKINLPPLEKVHNHPTSIFIDNFASGDIRNLEQQNIYLGYKDNENCIGQDLKFDRYGIHKSYPRNKNWLQKIFS